ncbi:hypothetical protein C0389_08225 [bacterium]|nr:hypothetical protein [bacterium]
MSKRNDKLLLLDILDSIHKILLYTKGLDFRTFAKDQKTIDAVVRNIEIIGEASKHVSKKLKDKSAVPWIRIVGLRNRIVHEYFGVDLRIVWKIITEQLIDFEETIKELITITEK